MSSTVKIHEAGCTCQQDDDALQILKPEFDDEHLAMLSEIPWSF